MGRLLKILLGISTLLIITFSHNVHANKVNLTGSLKTHGIFGDHAVVGDEGRQTNFSSFTTARINGFYAVSAKSNLEMAYALSTQWGETESQNTPLKPLEYRAYDIDKNPDLGFEDNIHVVHNIDRLIWNYSLSDIDFFAGRQAISLGSGRTVNPTDVFLPFPIGTFDSEFRTGIDAFRVKIPMGKMGEFDGGVVLGEEGKTDKSAYFANFALAIKNFFN